MILPTIHMNGTSKESLIDDLSCAYGALDDAYDAMKRAAPNGRDYYPQGPDALAQATKEHLDRLTRLDSIKAEIGALIEAIDAI